MTMTLPTKFKETEIGLIPEEWNVSPVGDFCSVMTSGGTPSRDRKDYYQNGNIPWVKTKELNDSYVYDTEEKITEDAIKNSAAKIMPKDTVSMAMYGATVGMLGILGIEASTNQACCNMITKDDSDFKFLFYSLLNKRQELINRANGAAQQNLSVSTIKSFNLAKPILEEQKQIAEILSSLDDKIELNRKINVNLEKLAGSLFKKWFVDIGAELPEGWRKARLEEFLQLGGGLAYDGSKLSAQDGGVPMITMGTVSPSSKFNFSGLKYYKGDFKAQHVAKPGDLIIATRDVTQKRETIGSPILVPDFKREVIFGTNLYKVTNNSKIDNIFFYYLLRTQHYREQIIASMKGSTVVMITKDAVLDFEFNLPPSDLVDQYIQIVKGISDLIYKNERENANLITTRDSLLPRLMSGKIRVNI